MAEQQADGRKPAMPREVATWVVRCLVDRGHTAYFAGGCVRDTLLGIEPDDYDVATSARPEEILQVFPRASGVGQSFGVMLVRRRGHVIQVATFRTDGEYSDSRHPDQVHFSDAEHDARRRDFTINGLFEDPIADRIIDYVGGQRDLEARLIRAIGDAHARLREDRLRMLRAVRFSARFAFAIEEQTADAIRQVAGELTGVSRERIGQEVRRMLTDPNRAVAAWEMQYLGLDATVLEEDHVMNAPTRLGRLPDEVAYPTALAAWWLDRHEREHEPDAVERAAAAASQWTAALMLANAERDAMRRTLDAYFVLRDRWESIGVAKQKRLAASEPYREALLILRGVDRPAFINIRRRVEELAQTELAPEPLIDGQDLIEAGLQPGPAFKRVLDAVYDAQLEGSVHEKDEAIALARTIARDYS